MADPGPKSRMRGAERRALITAAALEIFSSRGYHSASLGEIAKAAGVARTVMYDHFPSKRVLFLAVMHEQNSTLITYIGARIAGSGEPQERMRATIDAYLAFAESNPAARHLLFDRADEDDPEIRTVRQGIREARLSAVIAMLSADLRRIGIDPAEPATEAAVEMIITGLDGLAQWRHNHPGQSRPVLVEAAMQVLWVGLGSQQ